MAAYTVKIYLVTGVSLNEASVTTHISRVDDHDEVGPTFGGLGAGIVVPVARHLTGGPPACGVPAPPLQVWLLYS